MYIIFLLIILLLIIVISWVFQNIKWKITILKFIKEVFIALLSFSGSLVAYLRSLIIENIYLSLNNEACVARSTLID